MKMSNNVIYLKKLHKKTYSSNLVGESRTRVRVVEAFHNDWNQQNGNADQNGKPEVGRAHDIYRNAFVRELEGTGVEYQRNGEIANDAAPDEQVINTRPIRRLQTALKF
jgi:hypothetical protein